MYRTTIYGLEVQMQGSVFALMVYKDEFGTDFHQDYQKSLEGGYVSPTFLLQAAWAMARGHDDSVPQYKEWLGQMDAAKFSLTDVARITGWAEEVFAAILAECFRERPTFRSRIKRRLRRMGRVFKRGGGAQARVHPE